MAVAGLLTELEERLGILIEDHEVDADLLEALAPPDLRAAKALRDGEPRLHIPLPAGDGDEWIMRIGEPDSPPFSSSRLC